MIQVMKDDDIQPKQLVPLTWLTTASNSGDAVMGGFEEDRSSSLSSEGPHLT